ncbi:hypothetical protein Z517_06909 [Fonsecaea pedrosoi CBS 271.37]|uniref:Major facilitator superfamily (MFS) profile domain-containing protein n=1 Tax=Fonsecaea pedrosoi CBS 271.37 TaxID=1442368 RepID=A0A0D2H6I6_9EURO|nr:uncharacterized protein Z517_06909 [Fonsecaea pedrosoi CBS 271.37]KIW80294.1 hypothetical protein Z517_06909 [Fonsecaea pedrosoi CBS 271.37]
MARRKSGFFKHTTLKVRDDSVTRASELSVRQSILPIILVTTLYFLWGFAYGLLDTLNKHFQGVLGISRARSSGLQAAYFGAYPLASLGYANWILRHFSYKAVFMFGLTLYGIGGLLMWPAGLKRSFGGFCGATFIIGSGLGSLETAANPFIAVCGPPKYSELRINLAQSFNAVGTVVGPVLGSYAFFKNTGDDLQSLRNVQWVYLAIAIFVFILAFVFYISPIPEVTDADMEHQVAITHDGLEERNKRPFWKQYTVFHAAFSQFCYVGSQVALAGYAINYFTEIAPVSNATGAALLAGAQGCFAVGRFSGSLFMRFIRPRWIFLFYLTAVIAFCSAAITERRNTGIAMFMLTLFFESVCFPTIVALGIRGQGRHTKRAAGWIVGGVCGGAAVPPLLGATADWHNSTPFALVVPVCFFIASWTYALCVNFVPYYRIPADAIGESDIGLDQRGEGRASGADVDVHVHGAGYGDGVRDGDVEKVGAVQIERGGKEDVVDT